jgi:hypothetical protein
MSMMSTEEEILSSLRRKIESLEAENKMLKTIISKMSEKNICTCGIDIKGYTTGEAWMKCPVHWKSFKKGEI